MTACPYRTGRSPTLPLGSISQILKKSGVGQHNHVPQNQASTICITLWCLISMWNIPSSSIICPLPTIFLTAVHHEDNHRYAILGDLLYTFTPDHNDPGGCTFDAYTMDILACQRLNRYISTAKTNWDAHQHWNYQCINFAIRAGLPLLMAINIPAPVIPPFKISITLAIMRLPSLLNCVYQISINATRTVPDPLLSADSSCLPAGLNHNLLCITRIFSCFCLWECSLTMCPQ